MSENEFLISDLAEKSGVSVRTIRYYISQGLLPNPKIRGRYSVYNQEYLRRIEIIKKMKDLFLPIKEIKSILDSTSLDDIENKLNSDEVISPRSNDALAYISKVLNQTREKSETRPSIPLDPVKPLPAPMQFRQSASLPQNYDSPSNWKRLEIIPGLELHVEDRIFSSYRKQILDIIQIFKTRLSKGQ